jgi:methionyl-tRNA formyltransferase
LIYLGTSAFAAEVLKLLAETHRPELVVTRPDAPRGRGRRLAAPPVADTARELGIDVVQPEDVNAIELPPGDVVLCAYGALVREPLLSRGVLNLHPSLLPRWRGAAPVERAIMAGDAETGVSIMRLVADLDAGPVCLSEAVPIGPEDTYGTLAPRLQQVGATLLARTLDESPPWVDQPADGVTYAERITAEDRTLDPEAPPEVNERVVRALHPHIGARVQLEDGSWLGVLRARVGEGPLAWHGLELLEVQPPGGRPMDAEGYLRGR